MEIHYCTQNTLNIEAVLYLLCENPGRCEGFQSLVLGVNKLQKREKMSGVSGYNLIN